MEIMEVSMNSRGFTVIELLIATAIFSLVLTGLTIAFIQQQRQFHLAEEDVDIDQTGRTTLNYIASQVRNASSRQGKLFSFSTFINGGSTVNNPCTANTSQSGTVNSPPDCLTIYTWDITRGEDTTQPANPMAPRFPSTPGVVSVVSQGPPLVLQLPSNWFSGGKLIGESINPPPNNILLGFRSRINLCSPNPNVNCGTTPWQCSECAAILSSTVDATTMQATIANNVNAIVQHNFPVTFSSMTNFINGSFMPSIATLSNEMTIVKSTAFSVDPNSNCVVSSKTSDTNSKSLEIVQNGVGGAQPIAGGCNAPGIVDLQFVFNLMDSDGGTTKVGVPESTANRKYPSFDPVKYPSLLGRQKDIISVEIYLLVRSRVKAPLIQGGNIPVQTIPAVGDALQRTTSPTSDTFPVLGAGFVYRFFSTTVYMRNMSREDFW